MEVDPILALLSALPFLATVLGLHLILWKPMLHLLEQREENVDGFKRSAAEVEKASVSRLAELEARLLDAKNRASAERTRLRAEAARAEEEIIDAARKTSELELNAARARLADHRKEAQSGIAALSQELAIRAASSVLGRPVVE